MSQDMSQGQKPSTPLTTREGKGEGLFYNGIPYADIIAKYWELFNDGKEPVEGDRNALTFELAVTLRSICGFSLEKMMAVIPNYWRDNGEEYRKTIPKQSIIMQKLLMMVIMKQ